MQIERINLDTDLPLVQDVIQRSFSQTPDSNIDDWFSINEMVNSIQSKCGICLKATNGNGIIGIIHAQTENPINGREGKEKWAITNISVIPGETGKGVGSQLLRKIEEEVGILNVIKMFVHTNEGDDKVIHFYKKNGYQDAGSIRDYYYDGSAVFLIKYLSQS